MRNLVGKADSMAKYSFLRVDGGRREKRMLIHGLLVSQFLKSHYFFTRCVCEFFSLSENWPSRWRNIIVRDSLWNVKSGWEWIGLRSFSKCFTRSVCLRGQQWPWRTELSGWNTGSVTEMWRDSFWDVYILACGHRQLTGFELCLPNVFCFLPLNVLEAAVLVTKVPK